MIDLTELMRAVPVTSETTSMSCVQADLGRGRRARRLSVLRRLGATVGATAAVTAAVAFVALPRLDATTLDPQPQTVSAVLVRYTSEQPAGFTIDQVPSGWRVLTSTGAVMVLGAAADRGEDLHSGVISFRDRIAVDLVDADSLARDGRVFDVDGARIGVTDPDAEGTVTATVPQEGGRGLSIVLPRAAGLTGAEAAAFAAGVHATGSATPSHG